jgi:hypothetical protein
VIHCFKDNQIERIAKPPIYPLVKEGQEIVDVCVKSNKQDKQCEKPYIWNYTTIIQQIKLQRVKNQDKSMVECVFWLLF